MWDSNAPPCSYKVLAGNPDDKIVKEDTIVKVCNQVDNSGVVACFKEAGKGFKGEGLEQLCKNVEDEQEGKSRAECSRAGLEGGLDNIVVAKLCAGGVVTLGQEFVSAPVDCAMSAPYGFTGNDVLKLCEGAVSTGPSMCAKSVPNGFSNSQKAVLCSQATGAMPVSCLEVLEVRSDHSWSVLICQ